MLTLTDNRTAFRPGEEIAGAARWSCAQPPKQVEISLCWSTRGKGSPDGGAVEITTVTNPMAQGEHAFRFTAPPLPYSFSGALIAVAWAVELFIDPSDKETERIEIVIAPEARSIKLPRIAQEENTPTSLVRKFLAKSKP